MTKRIASLYFAAVEAKRPIYGGYYKIPAVEKGGKPFILEIEDKLQQGQEPSPDGKSKVLRRDTIFARDIANCILREWTRDTIGMTPDCGPGIWIVRDEIPVTHDGSDPKYPVGSPKFDAMGEPMWRPATQEEKDAMWAEDLHTAKLRDAAWADWLITDGDRKEAEEERRFIGPLHRAACRHYGRDREWLEELKDGDVKVCKWCTKRIAVAAIVCPHCQRVVDPARAAEEDAKDEQIKAGMTKGVVRPPVTKTA